MTTVKEYNLLEDEDKVKFWEGLNEKSQKRLLGWSAQIKVPLSELKEKFQASIVALTAQLKDQDVDDNRIESIARSHFADEIRPGRSKAETFEGIVLGYSILKDWNDFWFNVAKGAFNKDPLQARMDGVCDDNGIALVTTEIKDKKTQYFRQNVGEMLKHDWERHVLAIGRAVERPKDDNTMRVFHINLKGEPARFLDPKLFPAPPVGLICRWRCNVQEINKEWNWVRANGATITKFEPSTVETSAGPVSGVFDAKRCSGLLNQVKPNFRSEIINLKSWLDEHAKQSGHFVVVEGEILNMYASAMRIGNADQQDLEDIPSLYVKLDPAIIDQMFYGVRSSVICACNPYEQKARERDEDGKWVVAVDEVGETKKEIVADSIVVFPTVAMPIQTAVVPGAPAKVPEAEAEPEPEAKPEPAKEEPTTIEL